MCLKFFDLVYLRTIAKILANIDMFSVLDNIISFRETSQVIFGASESG